MDEMRRIVERALGLSSVLRDDGISQFDHALELGYLITLRVAALRDRRPDGPAARYWERLWAAQYERSGRGDEVLRIYRELLAELGRPEVLARPFTAVFASAETRLRQGRHLALLLQSIEGRTSRSLGREELVELYQALLDQLARDQKGSAQYFTPHPLTECIVELVKPRLDEFVQDPAAGSGGLLIQARRHASEFARGQARRARPKRWSATEVVQPVHRLLTINLALHDVEADLFLGDALSTARGRLPPADVMMANPPFGRFRSRVRVERSEFPFETTNAALAFVQHIYSRLRPGGRAAVVVPDGVLFAGGPEQRVRTLLLDHCNLHTILRLPPGVFYAHGVKASVLFFTKGSETERTWFYDLRTNGPALGRRQQLSPDHLSEFMVVFGDSPHGLSPRHSADSETGRWRAFSRAELRQRDDNLDTRWLVREEDRVESLAPPRELAAEIATRLERARVELDRLERLQQLVRPRPAKARAWVCLTDYVEHRVGMTRARFVDEDWPEFGVLRSRDIEFDGVELSNLQTARCSPDDIERHGLRESDLVLCRQGPPKRIGLSSLVTADAAGLICGSSLIRMRITSEELEPRYLQLVCMAWFATGVFARITSETGTLLVRSLLGLHFGLLPRPEQRALVDSMAPSLAIAHVQSRQLVGLADRITVLEQSIVAHGLRMSELLTRPEPARRPASVPLASEGRQEPRPIMARLVTDLGGSTSAAALLEAYRSVDPTADIDSFYDQLRAGVEGGALRRVGDHLEVG